MSRIAVTIDGVSYEIDVRQDPAAPALFTAVVNGAEVPVYVPKPDEPASLEWVVVENRPHELDFERDLHWVTSYLGRHHLEVRDLDAAATRAVNMSGRVKAPIPGLVTRVLVQEGDEVTVGQPLLVLEAMKMENEIAAPRSGKVTRLDAYEGRSVMLDELLAEIE